MFKMTEAELEAMYRRKEEFLSRLQLTFTFDPRSGVKRLKYHRDFNGYPEVVEIKFDSGYSRYINVTGNSDGANYRQIGNVIYGGEVVGEFYVKEDVNAGTDV